MSDDTADSGLIDVSGLSLSELRNEVEGSSLTAVLDRILSIPDVGGHQGFRNHI